MFWWKYFINVFFINLFLVLTLIMLKFVKTSTINLMTRGFDDLTLSHLWNKMWQWQDGMVWFSYVWDNIHLKLVWKFHQDLTCFGCFREDLELGVVVVASARTYSLLRLNNFETSLEWQDDLSFKKFVN